eukprot:TRINITY_DN7450_c0_g1_i1.p1 TRINITY_DN7450_c0_g1~~TRINITY_DN7450_c0_g1_i1.p1  ORF type:complete len:282 (-),score=59.88 TRINITY_DN7450_c0_g1_i1:360-1205(-)
MLSFWKSVLALSFLIFLIVRGQDTPPCVELPSEVNNTVDPSVLLPLIALSTQSFEDNLGGLSVEEAAEAMPQAIGETVGLIVNQVSPPGTVLQAPLISRAVVQGVLNVTNIDEIFSEAAKNPLIIVNIFSVIIEEVFDLDCFDNPNIVVTSILTEMLGDVTQFSLQDQFAEIFNTTVVVITKQFGFEEQVLSFMDPVIDAIQAAQTADEALAGLVDSLTTDVVQTALSSALQASGLIVEPEVVGALFRSLGDAIRESYQIDNKEFVTFVVSMFEDVVNALK